MAIKLYFYKTKLVYNAIPKNKKNIQAYLNA